MEIKETFTIHRLRNGFVVSHHETNFEEHEESKICKNRIELFAFLEDIIEDPHP